MKTFEDLQKFLADVQSRKLDLNDQKNALIMQREKLRESWEDAVFAGEGVQKAKAAMADLESRIDDLNDHIRIMEQKVKTSSKVRDLARAVHSDCSHTVKGVKANYLAQADKVQKARDSYLRELRILGEIFRVGNKYSFYASEASRYLPDHVFVGIGVDKFKEVSLDHDLVRRTYQNGNK